MTGAADFVRVQSSSPKSDAERRDILAAPGFGRHFTDHMVSIDYTAGKGWHDAQVLPYGNIELDPAAMVLHYGQAIFEGLKAYRQPGGEISSFRVEANAERFRGICAPSGHAGAPVADVHRFHHRTDRRRSRLGSRSRWRGRALPPSVHVLHRSRTRCPSRRRVPLPADRLACRCVLPARRQAGQCVAVHRIRSRGPRRYRRGQVRRQLRRFTPRPGASRRRGLRPGGLARRHRAPRTSRKWVE